MTPANPPRRSPRRHTSQGQQTRQTILKVAMDIASVEGLEGLSIGRLATELGMSKSGLFAHFGSKEDLQLATIEAALDIFRVEVIKPTYAAPKGIARLLALGEAWFSYGERKVFPGGCFFAAVAAEFDSRPGAVHDRIAGLIQQWLDTVEQVIREAQNLGEVDPTLDPAQLAFELNAFLWGANSIVQLQKDPQAIDRARKIIFQRIQGVTVETTEA